MRGLVADRLSETLSTLGRKHHVPGAQFAIHNGGETLAIEVGELEYGTGRLVERDSAFPIGSITKSFTATVAMILVADGDLELDAPLGEYLPELGSGADDIGAQLTLRQLLSHTSGLRDGPSSTEIAGSSLRRYVLDNCRPSDLILPPGSNFSYSNSGYVVAGHLIEVITGMCWWDAMESILLRPLGIEPTFLVAPDPRPSGRPIAVGHSVNASVGRTRPIEQSLALAQAPSSGLAVSAVDLVTFGLIQLGRAPTVLPSPHSEQMRQPVPGAEPFGLADGWGLGLEVFSSGNATWVGHDGNAGGAACYVRAEPVNGCVVAFTCNANIGGGMWQDLVGELGRAGLTIGGSSTVAALGPPMAPPPDCIGSYLLNGDIEFSVAAQDKGDLSLKAGDEVLPLVFHEGLIFSQEDPTSGQRIPAGRFLRNPITGDLDLIQIGGRVMRRRVTPDPSTTTVPPR